MLDFVCRLILVPFCIVLVI